LGRWLEEQSTLGLEDSKEFAPLLKMKRKFFDASAPVERIKYCVEYRGLIDEMKKNYADVMKDVGSDNLNIWVS